MVPDPPHFFGAGDATESNPGPPGSEGLVSTSRPSPLPRCAGTVPSGTYIESVFY